jgi:hypothetical protein
MRASLGSAAFTLQVVTTSTYPLNRVFSPLSTLARPSGNAAPVNAYEVVTRGNDLLRWTVPDRTCPVCAPTALAQPERSGPEKREGSPGR